jgi:putative membrane protein insertion efficiency factor
MGRDLALFAIRVYQHTLSPDHGPMRLFYPDGCCRFAPSCSEYGYGCIKRHGLWKGSVLALWRVLRCNPFSRGGNDPVPE